MIVRLSVFLFALALPALLWGLPPKAHAVAPAADLRKHSVIPTVPLHGPDGRRWRIGYLESGAYAQYPWTLAQIMHGLQKLEWLHLEEDIPPELGGRELWKWLGRHIRSEYLELVPDAWWQPGDFDASRRAPVRDAISQRLRSPGDIDLMIAMGTWAGQDMRAIGPPVPTIVASSSAPVAAGISDNEFDSGRANLHARVEPRRFERQVELFHEILPFRTLGIVFEDSPEGRSYAAVDAVREVSGHLGFGLKECHAPSSSIPTAEATANAVACYRRLAEENVDAVYVTTHRGVTPSSIGVIATILKKAKIPSFSMNGSNEVRQGILLSLAQADLSYVGLFHAETMARIFHGAEPRQLSQIWVDPPKIALNLATARAIGFAPPVDILLAADEVYQFPAYR